MPSSSSRPAPRPISYTVAGSFGDRLREPFYMGLLALALGLLWTVAWAGAVNAQHESYMPPAKPNLVYASVEEDAPAADAALSTAACLPCAAAPAAVAAH